MSVLSSSINAKQQNDRQKSTEDEENIITAQRTTTLISKDREEQGKP